MPECRIPRPSDPAGAARAEVIELLFAYVRRLESHFEAIARAHDLTPMQAKVVLHLREPSPMRSVSDSLCCDPSNITGIVDRLEERGLLARTEDRSDRRVKSLQPTPAGRKLREAFEQALFRDIPGMKGLSRADLKDLRDLLAMLGAPSAETAKAVPTQQR
jgi:DNA-binding MarR family transcriptional regulator